MMRPNLFILGAPKCGTTAMAKWLSQHPEVFVSRVKEPHYFSEEYRLTASLQAYEALFVEADPQRHRWACEASVWHLFSDTAVPNILRYSPDARFIVMVRNPVEMAPSMHEQQRFNGNELETDFAKALALNSSRLEGQRVRVRNGYLAPEHLAYLHSCALGWQVARLLERVPRQNVHVIVHDDMTKDVAREFSRVLDFLGLAAVDVLFEKVNPAKRRKSFLLDWLVLRLAAMKGRLGISGRLGLLRRLRRWNVEHRPRAPIADSVLDAMATAYGDDATLLGATIGRDLSTWTARHGR